MEQHSQPADVLDLRDYLAVAARRWRTIVGVAVMTLAVALAISLTTPPTYRSSTEVVVVPVRSSDSLEQLLFRQAGMGTQAKIAGSLSIAEQTVERLGLAIDPHVLVRRTSATPIRDTNVLEIAVTWGDAQTAADLAQTLSEVFLASRQSEALAGQDEERRAILEEIASVRDRIDELDREIVASSDDSSEAARRQERDTLLTRLGQLTAQSTTFSSADVTGGGEIILPAEVPTRPISPKPARTAVLAMVLGLMLGTGLAFLRDFLDDAVRGDDDLRRATSGLPVLGHMPRHEGGRDGARPPLVTLVAPMSPASEAVRTLRSNLRFLATNERLRSVVVTSAGEAEGKTTVACNLAVAATMAGTRVILVDADLRRPTVHANFGLDNLWGLSELIVGEADVVDACREVGVPRLRVITAGMRPPNPAELLASPMFARLMRDLEQLADVVIIDSPPVLPVADTLEVAHLAVGTLIVAASGATSRRAVRDAVQRLNDVGANVLGTVRNKIDEGDGYYYAYSYGDDAGPGRRAAGRNGSPSKGSPSKGSASKGSASQGSASQGSAPEEGRLPAVPGGEMAPGSAERVFGGDEPMFTGQDGGGSGT